MAASNRTGIQAVTQWVTEAGGKAEAARQLGWSRQRLGQWLNDDTRSMKAGSAKHLAMAAGLPIEAVLFKHARITDAVAGRVGSVV